MTDTIYRVQKSTNYSVVSNEFINDPGISAKAKGILLYLLSKPNDWVASNADIVNHMADGIDSIKSGIRELKGARYLRRTQRRDEAGRITGWETLVYEHPYPEVENPSDGKTATQSAQKWENHPQGKPQMENPSMENPPLLNTDLVLNTENPLSTDHKSHASRCDERGQMEQGENPQESEPATESVTAAVTAESEVVATPTVAEEDRGSGRKKSKKKQTPQYSSAFERWWCPEGEGGYYRFALAVDASPGVKPEAWVQFQELWADGEPSEDFWEGDRYYQETKQRQFVERGQAVGVPHGCRYLKNSKWKEALDHKRLQADKPQLSKADQKAKSLYERTMAAIGAPVGGGYG